MIIATSRPIALYTLHSMKRKDAIPSIPTSATALLLPEQLAAKAADAVRELLAEAAAANTTRSYTTALRYWAGCEWMPLPDQLRLERARVDRVACHVDLAERALRPLLHRPVARLVRAPASAFLRRS